MDLGLKGRVALVTGGREVALTPAREGAQPWGRRGREIPTRL